MSLGFTPCKRNRPESSHHDLQPSCRLYLALVTMGSICSKQSAMSGGHRLVEEPNTESAGQERPDPRTAAAQAAEQRLKAVSGALRAPLGAYDFVRVMRCAHSVLQNQKRGVVSSNPQSGRLAAQVEAGKAAPRAPEPRQEERIVVGACSAISTAIRRSTEGCRCRSGTDGMSIGTIVLSSARMLQVNDIWCNLVAIEEHHSLVRADLNTPSCVDTTNSLRMNDPAGIIEPDPQLKVFQRRLANSSWILDMRVLFEWDLQWADEKTCSAAVCIRPTFPELLLCPMAKLARHTRGSHMHLNLGCIFSTAV